MAETNNELVQLLVSLTPKEQMYVQLRAQGMSKAAASRGAGFKHDNEGIQVERRDDVGPTTHADHNRFSSWTKA